MADPVTLRWVPTEDDLLRAYAARRGLLGSRRRELTVVAAVLVVAGVLAVAGQPAIAAVLGAVGAFFAFPATGAALAGRSIRRVWRANPFLAEPVEARFSDDGFHQQSETRAGANPWSSFSSWIEAPDVLVLNLSDTRNGASITVPTRAAPDPATLDAVRAVLRQHLGDPLAR